ncbi:MAG: AMP-dependent synthetase/ligase [Aeromonas sp.]
MPNSHLVRLIRERIAKLGNKPVQRVQQDGQWRDISWHALGQAMDYCAQALIRAGHQPGEMVGICARNMPEWTQADLGILAARGVSVPIYPTNTTEQVRYILRDAKISTLFVGEQAQFDQALTLLNDGELRQIIALDPQVDLKGCAAASHFQAFLVSGNHTPSADALVERAQQYQMDDLLTLIYTSGTTGEPKGVMLDFANVFACFEMHDRRLDLSADDVSLSFLPLSHVFERVWTYYVLYCGALNVYLRDPMQVMDVLGEVKPTVMCSVPRLYEKAYSLMHTKMAQMPAPRRALLRWAEQLGKAIIDVRQAGGQPSAWQNLQYALADKLIYSKLRDKFGGRMRFLPVAGARLADDVNLFFQSMGLNIKYGYGMTETTATVCCYADEKFKLGSIGTVMPGIEVKLGENNELLVRSPTVMRGYYNKPEATAEVMTEDGFLRTGDAAQIDAEGHIYFTERLKELMKTSNGKYVAPQLVEGVLGKDPLIEQVAIFADGHNFVSALVVPNSEELAAIVAQADLGALSAEARLTHPKVLEKFTACIQAQQSVLARHEQVKKFTLLAQPFSMEAGELTPTMKLRRKVIEAKYQAQIAAMYQGS